MHTLEFNTENQELKTVSGVEQSLYRSNLPGSSATLEKQPVDRSRFFTNTPELFVAVNSLSTLLVGKDERADSRSVIKAPSSLMQIGDQLTSEDIQALRLTNSAIGTRLDTLSTNGRNKRAIQAQSEDWWSRFSDTQYFSHNVFHNDPTEQLIIGQDQIEPVTIYNFGEKLRKRHIEGIVGAVAAMSAMTDGYTRAISPYIVIHDAFLSQYFEQSKTHDKAAGRAWLGEPFIEARRSSFDGSAKGSVGQPWVSQLIGHEISHQIDEATSSKSPDFNSYFHYVDTDSDGLVDYIKPTKSFASEYDTHEIQSSVPVRKYGYTNGAEDLATVGEELPFGGYVDTLRRNAYMEIVEAFKEKSQKKYGDMQPMPEKLKVEIARGGEIKLPVAPALARPIEVRVENANDGLVNNLLRKIFKL